MELDIVLSFVKFGPNPSSNPRYKYDLNNGDANNIMESQFKGEHEESSKECHFLTPTIKSSENENSLVPSSLQASCLVRLA